MERGFFTNTYDLVIFDRDGVINRAPQNNKRYVLSLEELFINSLVLKFIVDLQAKGIFACVATNQQCVGKKLISVAQLNEIHTKIVNNILASGGEPIKFFVCPHLVEVNCLCRKPKPGLLNDAINFFGISPAKTLFIGDSISDKEAADSAKVDFMFIENLKLD